MDTLIEYADTFIEDGKRRMHEDKFGCHIFVLTRKGLNKDIRCFDEKKGIIGRFLGNKKVFCYDEYNGTKIAITLIYRFSSLRIVILTTFKKGVDIKWPPVKNTSK
ncbi:MAG: hypothetical protein N3A00_00375 [Thermodesulfovibrio sp.]|nr:hypothetical protein [Thermodesulfovibrio sp.]